MLSHGHTSGPSAALVPDRDPHDFPAERAPAALAAVVHALDDMAWLADETGAIHLANAAFTHDSRLVPGPAGLSALYGPVTTGEQRRAVAAAFARRQRLRIELDLVRHLTWPS